MTLEGEVSQVRHHGIQHDSTLLNDLRPRVGYSGTVSEKQFKDEFTVYRDTIYGDFVGTGHAAGHTFLKFEEDSFLRVAVPSHAAFAELSPKTYLFHDGLVAEGYYVKGTYDPSLFIFNKDDGLFYFLAGISVAERLQAQKRQPNDRNLVRRLLHI